MLDWFCFHVRKSFSKSIYYMNESVGSRFQFVIHRSSQFRNAGHSNLKNFLMLLYLGGTIDLVFFFFFVFW